MLISAAHKSSGKTTITLGLCAALRSRGVTVAPFKKGPDYIDPLWLGLAAGRPCYNLDFWTMESQEIRQIFTQQGAGADITLVEGNKGLHDGLALDGSNSNAALAKLLGIPVILVVDCQGITRGIAPLVLGYQSFDPTVQIAGVILNQVGGQRHEAKLRAALEHYTEVPVLGAVARDSRLAIVERHLGLVPSNEAQGAVERVATIGKIVGSQVDLTALLALATPKPPSSAVIEPFPSPRVRIGIPQDGAFAFYYPDDLLALRAAGAELIFFNALQTPYLPVVDGLFIGGGFPEVQMTALEANVSLRTDIRRAIDDGLPVYAECGGLMYLARRIRWGEQCNTMVGALPVDVLMTPRPIGRGYVQLQETIHHPWPVVGTQQIIPGHEFHYSHLENLGEGFAFAYQMVRGVGVAHQQDGIIYRNCLACYSHQRHTRGNPWATAFVDFIHRQRLIRG